MPNSSAQASPSASRSAPIATTRAGNSASSDASSSARRFDPPPEIRTTSESTLPAYRSPSAARRGRTASGERTGPRSRTRAHRRIRPPASIPMPAATAISAAASSPTIHGFGPTSWRRPGPERTRRPPREQAEFDARDDTDADRGQEDPARAVDGRRAVRRATGAVRPRGSRPAAERAGRGIRTRGRPSAARRRAGRSGSGPAGSPTGPTDDPVPIAKPGPISQAAVQMTKLGMNAAWATVSAAPPSAPLCSRS